MISVSSVSCNDARMVLLRSVALVHVNRASGIAAIRRGSSAFTASTASMMFAPG